MVERLESLCRVLGSNFEEKLEEIGISPGHEADEETKQRLEQMIQLLEGTKASRFRKLKTSGSKLIELWKFHGTLPLEILKFSEVLICLDLASSDELTEPKFLSMSVITKANQEIDSLEAAKVTKLEKIYLHKKQKLLKLIEQSHLVVSDVGFDPKKEVTSNFSSSTEELKVLIEKVKVKSLARKEIVIRTELLEQAVDQSMCMKIIKGFLRALRILIQEPANEVFLYDGRDIKVFLNNLEARAKKGQAGQVGEASSSARVEIVNNEEKADEEGLRRSRRLKSQGSTASARLKAQEGSRGKVCSFMHTSGI